MPSREEIDGWETWAKLAGVEEPKGPSAEFVDAFRAVESKARKNPCHPDNGGIAGIKHSPEIKRAIDDVFRTLDQP